MSFFRTQEEFNLVKLAASLSDAAYGGEIPTGWKPVSAGALGLSSIENGYYSPPGNSDAVARVMASNDGRISIAFRGTDSLLGDGLDDLILLFSNRAYALAFSELIEAVSSTYTDREVIITGHSLGGAPVNVLSTIYAEQAEGMDVPWTWQKAPLFVAFSSPLLTDESHVINYGHRNDFIFGFVNHGADLYSTPEDVRYVGTAPFPSFSSNAHNLTGVEDAVTRLQTSHFHSLFKYDSAIIILGMGNLVGGRSKAVLDGSVAKSGTFVVGIDAVTKGSAQTTANDYIVGSKWSEKIDGMRGNDVIFGNNGNDTLYGGAGNDLLIGGSLADALYGGADNDTFRFAEGDVAAGEIIDGGAGIDRISGSGMISFRGSTIRYVDGVTFLGAGRFYFDDTQIGTTLLSSTSTISGSVGANELVVRAGTSNVAGNVALGNLDIQSWDSGDVIYILGNAKNDVLYGSQRSTRIYGYDGKDTIYGMGADDILDGGAGADRLSGGRGNDVYFVDNVGDSLVEVAGRGDDTVYASVNYTLAATADIEFLRAKSGTSGLTLTGNQIANSIYGSNGNDSLYGGDGSDRLYGGRGVDRLDGGSGDDTFVFYVDSGQAGEKIYGGDGVDTAALAEAGAINLQKGLVNGAAIGLSSIERLQGSSGADILTGYTNIENVIDGGRGADTMTGGRAADTYFVESKSDKIIDNLPTDYWVQDTVYLTGVGFSDISVQGKMERAIWTSRIGDKNPTVSTFGLNEIRMRPENDALHLTIRSDSVTEVRLAAGSNVISLENIDPFPSSDSSAMIMFSGSFDGDDFIDLRSLKWNGISPTKIEVFPDATSDDVFHIYSNGRLDKSVFVSFLWDPPSYDAFIV